MTTFYVSEGATDLGRRQATAHEIAAQRYPDGHKKRLQHLKAAAHLRGEPMAANERTSGQRRTEEFIRETMVEISAATRRAYRATQLLYPGPFHTTRTAKKSWQCEECHGAIPAGSRYLDTWGDYIGHNRHCLSCAGQELSEAE